MHKFGVIAVTVVGGLALSACGGGVPSAYVSARAQVAIADRALGAALQYEITGARVQTLASFRREAAACGRVAADANGPSNAFNVALKRFAKDCITQARGDIAFREGTTGALPLGADSRSTADARSLNAIWKQLGY